MKSRSLLNLLVLLLIAPALPSCKSPTATTQSSAFTLILPDSIVTWGDSAMMIVVPAKPLSSSSVFSWTFGDSSSLVSRSDTIIHYYPDTGVFTMKVDLNDTSNKSQLGKESGTVNVEARHFNLALLQSMPYVDVIWNAKVITDTQGSAANSCGNEYIGVKPTIWTGNNFSMDSNYVYNYRDSSVSEIINSISAKNSINGNIDSNFTQIVEFLTDTNVLVYQSTEETSFACSSNISFSVQNVPFKNQSASEVVFEADGNFIRNPNYQFSLWGQSSATGYTSSMFSVTSSADWTNMTVHPYIIIRFRK